MAGLIVHEWFAQHGGSENVVETMAQTFPDAEIACLWNDSPDRFDGRAVTESWLAKTPLRRSKATALPFMPATWAMTDVSASDFLLVSSHLFAHHVGGRMVTGGPRKHVYVHTPARYIWAPHLDRRGDALLARALAPLLKKIDAARAAQGATFAANSEFVRERIAQAWDQDSVVIPPPVRVNRIQSTTSWRDHLTIEDEAIIASLPQGFILAASRFTPYKRLDAAITAGEAADIPVVIAGSGPQRDELNALAAMASVPVYVVESPSNELLYALYQAAEVFVFLAVEDFGIMPVEAMSLGTPTLVTGVGGASESVNKLHGGTVIDSLSRDSLARGLSDAMSMNMDHAKAHAMDEFGEETFSRRLKLWMFGDQASRTGEAVHGER